MRSPAVHLTVQKHLAQTNFLDAISSQNHGSIRIKQLDPKTTNTCKINFSTPNLPVNYREGSISQYMTPKEGLNKPGPAHYEYQSNVIYPGKQELQEIKEKQHLDKSRVVTGSTYQLLKHRKIQQSNGGKESSAGRAERSGAVAKNYVAAGSVDAGGGAADAAEMR